MAGPDPTAARWDATYEAHPSEELGWFEPEPSTLDLVTAHSAIDDGVIDVGGGDSALAARLLDLGYRDITVLDVSQVAIDRARSRLGPRAASIRWIRADVTSFEPDRTWSVWHDRAVFHFLVDATQREHYRAVAANAVAPGGLLVVATFALDAPDRCAGLPVARYDGGSLAAALAPDFEPLDVRPIAADPLGGGDQRPYVGAVLRRRTATVAGEQGEGTQ